MFITPSFKNSLIVEQFQGNYLKYRRMLQCIAITYLGLEKKRDALSMVNEISLALQHVIFKINNSTLTLNGLWHKQVGNRADEVVEYFYHAPWIYILSHSPTPSPSGSSCSWSNLPVSTLVGRVLRVVNIAHLAHFGQREITLYTINHHRLC